MVSPFMDNGLGDFLHDPCLLHEFEELLHVLLLHFLLLGVQRLEQQLFHNLLYHHLLLHVLLLRDLLLHYLLPSLTLIVSCASQVSSSLSLIVKKISSLAIILFATSLSSFWIQCKIFKIYHS